ncbi:hypothetical protein DPEC_G00171390 [Dallia pectoralis]|uniref:Uncharacterized protein n=1 Tax=Dallia pectoralis TaxID=75939 RepID=A0ACC2GDE2_DALPE|nr:hypothetical protein DPEC_G00171390 [Dallia pectoralis]
MPTTHRKTGETGNEDGRRRTRETETPGARGRDRKALEDGRKGDVHERVCERGERGETEMDLMFSRLRCLRFPNWSAAVTMGPIAELHVPANYCLPSPGPPLPQGSSPACPATGWQTRSNEGPSSPPSWTLPGANKCKQI